MRKILNSWSISESPYKVLVEKMETDCSKTWKRGFPPIISATMAPRDQMSIGVEYLAQPSRISGALRSIIIKWSKSIIDSPIAAKSKERGSESMIAKWGRVGLVTCTTR